MQDLKFWGFFGIHSLFLNYTLFGGIISDSKAPLLIHASILPLTILHWRCNNNECILTTIEHKIAKNTKYEFWVNRYPLFSQRYLNILGINLSEVATEKLIRIFLGFSWCYTIFKLSSLYYQPLYLEKLHQEPLKQLQKNFLPQLQFPMALLH